MIEVSEPDYCLYHAKIVTRYMCGAGANNNIQEAKKNFRKKNGKRKNDQTTSDQQVVCTPKLKPSAAPAPASVSPPTSTTAAPSGPEAGSSNYLKQKGKCRLPNGSK